MEVELYTSLTSVLDAVEWSVLCSNELIAKVWWVWWQREETLSLLGTEIWSFSS
jgi:hypothetical protein